MTASQAFLVFGDLDSFGIMIRDFIECALNGGLSDVFLMIRLGSWGFVRGPER